MLLRIKNESERLDGLIEELLTLHRLEAGASVAPLERVDLIELLDDITEDADFEARATGRRVSTDAHGSFVVEVHGELIYRAFENVIRNAVSTARRAASWKSMRRSIRRQVLSSSRWLIEGPGVSPRCWKRFLSPSSGPKKAAGASAWPRPGDCSSRNADGTTKATRHRRAKSGGLW